MNDYPWYSSSCNYYICSAFLPLDSGAEPCLQYQKQLLHRKNEIFQCFLFFISLLVCPVISVSLLSFFSLLLSGLAGRLNYRKILIKNGSFPCLTGQDPHNSFHHSENFVTVRQRVLPQEKGKSFQYWLFKGLCFTDLLKISRLHKN